MKKIGSVLTHLLVFVFLVVVLALIVKVNILYFGYHMSNPSTTSIIYLIVTIGVSILLLPVSVLLALSQTPTKPFLTWLRK